MNSLTGASLGRFLSIPDIVWRDPVEGLSQDEREAYYDRLYPWRVRMRKGQQRRNARRDYAAQNSLWLAEYEDRLERVKTRWRYAAKRYLMGKGAVGKVAVPAAACGGVAPKDGA